MERNQLQREDKLLHREISELVLKSFYFSYSVLGFGFLESVYRNALALELRARGLRVVQERSLGVRYRDEEVGVFRLDLLVEGCLGVEVKATALLGPTDRRQLLNYLRAGSIDVGLLLHYGPEPKFHRLINPARLPGGQL